MAFCSFPDVFSWIHSLPSIEQWKSTSISPFNICSSSSSSSSQPSLKLSVKNLNNSSFSLSIFADYNLPIILWTSKPIPLKKLLDDESDTISTLLTNFIEDVLNHSANRYPNHFKLPRDHQNKNLKEIFNFSFLSLAFVVCIYEAPKDVRSSCLDALKDQFACPRSRGASRALMRMLGSNAEEQWMRSINLAITNWILELQGANRGGVMIKTPSSLFSYCFSAYGMWKVQLYCPVIAMNVEKASGSTPDERLLFSLNYHQLEGVIQMNYKVAVREKWIEVMVNTDNIRCDVVKLLTDTLISERGAGTSEKHFPSRIALQITPTTLQSNITSISVSKSSENPTTSITVEKGVEASFEPPTSIGITFSAGGTATTTMKPWKFEQSVYGNSANLNWFLHDSEDGREVFSSKPSKFALINQKAWFKNRYSNADRPFTRGGGVVFAGDEYGERVCWKVERGCAGRSMEWEIKGWIWATYWPNKHRSFYSETKKLEFREVVSLNLV